MSVFKPLSSRDKIVTPFTVHKHFIFTADEFDDSGSVGIDRFEGVPQSGLFESGSDPTGYIKTESKRLIYDSVKQLYYSNYVNQPLASGSFKNSLAGIFDDRTTYPLSSSVEEIEGTDLFYPYSNNDQGFASSTFHQSPARTSFVDANGDNNMINTTVIGVNRFAASVDYTNDTEYDLYNILNALTFGGEIIYEVKVFDRYTYKVFNGSYDVSTESFTFNVEFVKFETFEFGVGITPGWVEVSPPYDPLEVSTFAQAFPQSARFLPDNPDPRIGVLSIPSKLFGEYIKPNTFELTLGNSVVTDDGEGNIIYGSDIVGNIIYSQGIIIITSNESDDLAVAGAEYGTAEYGLDVYGLKREGGLIDTLVDGTNITCSFNSSRTIYEAQYKCTFSESDYNYSYNPSLSTPESTSESGSLIYSDYVTSSFFSPYVTTVGLYNNNQELLAIGKLSQPLPTSQTTDTTILINLDL